MELRNVSTPSFIVTNQEPEESDQLVGGLLPSVRKSAKEPTPALPSSPIAPGVTGIVGPSFRNQYPQPLFHQKKASGLEKFVSATQEALCVSSASTAKRKPHALGGRKQSWRRNSMDSMYSLHIVKENPIQKQKLLDRAPLEVAFEREVAFKQELAFKQAIVGKSGDNYMNVLTAYKELFRSGRVISKLPDNLGYLHLKKAACILQGALFKPTVKYTNKDFINSLCSLYKIDFLLKSFEVEIDFSNRLQEAGGPFQIPAGTFKVNLSGVRFDRQRDYIPSLPPSVKELVLNDTKMGDSDLASWPLQHIEVLYLTSNDITSDQLDNILQVSTSLKKVYIDICEEPIKQDTGEDTDADTKKDKGPKYDELPDKQLFEKLKAKYPKCDFFPQYR